LEHLSWIGALYGGIRFFVYGWFLLDIWWMIFDYNGFAACMHSSWVVSGFSAIICYIFVFNSRIVLETLGGVKGVTSFAKSHHLYI
jgi:hypothetical protein